MTLSTGGYAPRENLRAALASRPMKRQPQPRTYDHT
jgi:hypothetical protein